MAAPSRLSLGWRTRGENRLKSWLLCNLVCLALFVGLNGMVAMAVSQSPESVQAARLTPAPEGQRYLDACDGRPTAILGAGETSCLAD
jgi:hypothetical protein